MKFAYRQKRIFGWLIIIIVSFLSLKYAFFATENYIREKIFIPFAPIVHVDQQYPGSFQNGSAQFPFTKIQKALGFCKFNHNFNTILVSPGEYFENLETPDDTRIFGIKGIPVVKNPQFDNGKTVIAGDGLFLANLEIQGGNYGVYIPSNKSVAIYKSIIKSADKYGVYNLKHEHTESAKLSIIDSAIIENKKQGLYLQKGTFYLNKLLVQHNGEEGIDLHEEAKSKIINSIIKNNGEGGVETELGNVNLDIENCTIEGNQASGINIQSLGDNSQATIKKCAIKENADFGIRCAYHTAIIFPYFERMLTIGEDNVFSDNGLRQIDPHCYH